MYNGNYEVASLVYIYVYVGSRTIFFPVIVIALVVMHIREYYGVGSVECRNTPGKKK